MARPSRLWATVCKFPLLTWITQRRRMSATRFEPRDHPVTNPPRYQWATRSDLQRHGQCIDDRRSIMVRHFQAVRLETIFQLLDLCALYNKFNYYYYYYKKSCPPIGGALRNGVLFIPLPLTAKSFQFPDPFLPTVEWLEHGATGEWARLQIRNPSRLGPYTYGSMISALQYPWLPIGGS